MANTADVVIIGAGVIGLSTAYQIAKRSDMRVCVLERARSLGEGSTGASSAICRYRYTQDPMVQLAKDGIDAYRCWPEFTGLTDPVAQFHNPGVLWMPGDDGKWARAESARLRRLDVRCQVLDDAELSERFPALNPCVSGPDLNPDDRHHCSGGSGHLLELDGGYMDPMDVLADLARTCRDTGVILRLGSAVKHLLFAAGKVTGVELETGESWSSAVVVNAAGPWFARFVRQSGIAFPWTLEPTRIQVVHVESPRNLPGSLPVVADLSGGVYFRPQNRGQQIVVGTVREEDEKERVGNPDALQRVADDTFVREVLHSLDHRLPSFDYQGQITGYAGLYTINREDAHPVVGETELGGFYVANGFSGHGFKLAPAVGSLLAQAITEDQADFDTRISPDFLAVSRSPIAVEAHTALA